MFISILALPLLAAPGCGADTCQGVRSKVCSKACACGSDCVVDGIAFKSQTSCALASGVQCNPTKQGSDYAACSTALDTATCSMSLLVTPKECSDLKGGGGGGGGGSGSSGSTSGAVTSSGSM